MYLRVHRTVHLRVVFPLVMTNLKCLQSNREIINWRPFLCVLLVKNVHCCIFIFQMYPLTISFKLIVCDQEIKKMWCTVIVVYSYDLELWNASTPVQHLLSSNHTVVSNPFSDSKFSTHKKHNSTIVCLRSWVPVFLFIKDAFGSNESKTSQVYFQYRKYSWQRWISCVLREPKHNFEPLCIYLFTDKRALEYTVSWTMIVM